MTQIIFLTYDFLVILVCLYRKSVHWVCSISMFRERLHNFVTISVASTYFFVKITSKFYSDHVFLREKHDNFLRQFFLPANFPIAQFLFGEYSVRRFFRSMKIPFGENFFRQRLLTSKFPFGEISARWNLHSAKVAATP